MSFFSDAPLRTHLKSVYGTLTLSVMSAAVGAYVHLFTELLRGGGIAFALLGAGLALGLHFTEDTGKNRGQRLAMLLGFAFLTGLGMGPLLDLAIRINPAVVPNALLLSAAVFASFSGAALMAPDGQYLYLGGTLLSALSAMFWMGLLNIFFQSQLIFQVNLIFHSCYVSFYTYVPPSTPLIAPTYQSLSMHSFFTPVPPRRNFIASPGLPVGRPAGVLRLRHVRHSADHGEAPPRRQGLHQARPRALHRLRPDLQEGPHHPHAEGGQQGGEEEEEVDGDRRRRSRQCTHNATLFGLQLLHTTTYLNVISVLLSKKRPLCPNSTANFDRTLSVMRNCTNH